MGIPINSIIINTLVERGLLDVEKARHLFLGREYQEHEAIRKLVDESVLSEEDLMIVLSDELSFPSIDLSRVNFRKEIIKLIPERIAVRHNILPIARIGDCLTIVMSDPTDIVALDDVKAATGCHIEIALATRTGVKKALKANYGATEDQFSSIIELGSAPDGGLEVVDETEDVDRAGICRFSVGFHAKSYLADIGPEGPVHFGPFPIRTVVFQACRYVGPLSGFEFHGP